MSFSSDEVNALVFRYLQESGFVHSSFVFGVESNLAESNVNTEVVPYDGLVTLLRKSLLYAEAERSIGENGELDVPVENISLFEAVFPPIEPDYVYEEKIDTDELIYEDNENSIDGDENPDGEAGASIDCNGTGSFDTTD